MGTPQKAINDLRNGDFNEIITLVNRITEHYQPIVGHNISQDILQQLMGYELAQTDINEDDLRKLHIIERLVDGGEILNHLPGVFKASLLYTLSAFCSAISIKKIKNYQHSLPQEITSNNIQDFLNNESEFSQLISKTDCQASIANLNSFIMNNSDRNSINSLIDLEKGTPFISGITAQKKISQLKPICNEYISYLTTVIINYTQNNDYELNDFELYKSI